jgi:hypothetical protein
MNLKSPHALIIAGLGLLGSSCSDEPPQATASGGATIDGVMTEFEHLGAFEFTLSDAILAQVQTADGTQSLDISFYMGAPGSYTCTAAGSGPTTLMITYREAGKIFQAYGKPSVVGACQVIVTNGLGDGDDFVSVQFSGTLVHSGTGDTVTLTNAYVTVLHVD